MNETEAYWKKRYAILLEEIDDRFGLLIVGSLEVDVSKRMRENKNEKKDY